MQADVQANMWAGTPRDVSGLAALYTFTADTMYTEPGGKVRASSDALWSCSKSLLCHVPRSVPGPVHSSTNLLIGFYNAPLDISGSVFGQGSLTFPVLSLP